MSYYLRTGLAPFQIWKIDERVAVRIGITNPEQGPGSYFKASDGQTIWDAIKRDTPWFEPNGENPFVRTDLGSGEFYPRIARPTDQTILRSPLGYYPNSDREATVVALARGQLIALTRQLGRICQTVHPSEGTLEVFGHDIRNLLILACTEVENHWRGVLVANGAQKDRFTTLDYVALRTPMRLDDYSIAYPSYPWLEPFKPFDGWGTTPNPTKDLKWYDSYNAVKHSREENFDQGTLKHAFEAVSACAIMIAAQFGVQAKLDKTPELSSFLQFSSTPPWAISQVYIHPYDVANGAWRSVPFAFS
jgi:hypothetical protein